MRFGLFGKLQAKRDFIAVATPRAFLSVWEPWLQGGMSASRSQLGDKWQEAFLTAPIWRFWLGSQLCGMPVVGALMPSMDGVGRYFPLTVAAFADAGEYLAPPEFDSRDAWFAQVEQFLFATLEPATVFESVTAGLEQLPAPQEANMVMQPDQQALSPHPGVVIRGEQSFDAMFAQARRLDSANASAAMSYWWTAGGADFAPRAIAAPQMLDPYVFTSMLTGDLTPTATQPAEAQ